MLGRHGGDGELAHAEHVEGCERCTDRVARIAEAHARARRGGQERHLVPESAKKPSRRFRPYIVASVAAGVLLGALVANRMQREPEIIDLTTGASNRAVRAPLVRVFATTAEGPIELVDARPLREASTLRLYAEVPLALSLHVVTLDASGRAAEVDAALERPARSADGRRGFLAARIPAKADLRVFAVFSKGPLPPAALRRAAERAFVEAGRSLAAMGALPIESAHTHSLLVQIQASK